MNTYTFLINIANYIAKQGDVKMCNLLLFRARFLNSAESAKLEPLVLS